MHKDLFLFAKAFFLLSWQDEGERDDAYIETYNSSNEDLLDESDDDLSNVQHHFKSFSLDIEEDASETEHVLS